jgi:hypothetical protein
MTKQQELLWHDYDKLISSFFDTFFKLLMFEDSIPTDELTSVLLSQIRDVDWPHHNSCPFALCCERESIVVNDEDFVIPKVGSYFHLQNILTERSDRKYAICFLVELRIVQF